MKNDTSIDTTLISVKYTVRDMHPGRGRKTRGQIVLEETYKFPNPNGERFLKAAGHKYSELMEQWNGPKWQSQFIFRRGGCRYEVQYEYLDRRLR